MQRGGLARAVGADQGHQLAVAHRQGDTLEGVDRTVKYMQIFDFQHMCSSPLLAKIGRDNSGIGGDLPGQAGRDGLAIVDDLYPLAYVHHQ